MKIYKSDKIVKESITNVKKMSTEEALAEFNSKDRRMGCVAAVDWFCKRVDGLYPLRKEYVIKDGTYKGEVYQHVVATDGKVEIDVAPYTNKLKD